MKAKEFIHLFIPPILYKVKKRLFPKKQPVARPLSMRERKNERMVVIGNGPSLKKTVELYLPELMLNDCVMVNFAAMTDLFLQLKPTTYLLVDPDWYNPQDIIVDSVYACIQAIVDKTLWPMTIVMPRKARGSYTAKLLKTNTNIDVLYYEDKWSQTNKISQFEAWDKNLICPPGQTVLNTAIWLSIYWGYQETYLIGADTSWHAELKMDQEMNVLYTIDTHFYDNKKVYGDYYDEKQNRRPIGTKLHEELFAEATALQEYWELRGYADWKGVKVYNASEYSWIDAFERKKLR